MRLTTEVIIFSTGTCSMTYVQNDQPKKKKLTTKVKRALQNAFFFQEV